MREYLTLHRSVFPSYLTIESGRMLNRKREVVYIIYYDFWNRHLGSRL